MTLKKPQNRLYTSFSSSVEQKTKAAEKAIDNAEEKLKKSWSQTTTPTEDSCLDAKTIHKQFNRDDLQEDYKEYLVGNLIPIEATTIKLQNGFIAADEQAYRIRHYSLPRALATGYTDNIRWANGLIQFLLTNKVKKIQELAQKDFEENFTRQNRHQ